MNLRILIAPLDWGLGHASRCIPIIQYFREKGLQIFLASSGDAGTLLQQEFPDLPYFLLPSYDVHYRGSRGTGNSILRQHPKLQRAIRQEHEKTEQLVAQHQIDIVLSDNRYGVWSINTPNILLIHHIGVRAPFAGKVLDPLIRKYHYSYIRAFDRLWIPDYPGSLNLSGELSHGFILPIPALFIGPLSRFNNVCPQHDPDIANTKILAVLSGPEPYRTQFENSIIRQSVQYQTEVTIVRGLLQQEPFSTPLTVTSISYLTSNLLLKELSMSKAVICRSGYSSIMDLACTGKRAILVPTPGQTEQEYLARYHHQSGHYFSTPQQSFDLHESLNKSLCYKGLRLDYNSSLLDNAFENIIGEF